MKVFSRVRYIRVTRKKNILWFYKFNNNKLKLSLVENIEKNNFFHLYYWILSPDYTLHRNKIKIFYYTIYIKRKKMMLAFYLQS